jgi:hypothetical protein
LGALSGPAAFFVFIKDNSNIRPASAEETKAYTHKNRMAWISALDVRYAHDSSAKADIAGGPKGAMCGRLQVGKGIFHVCRLGRCSHVFGL